MTHVYEHIYTIGNSLFLLSFPCSRIAHVQLPRGALSLFLFTQVFTRISLAHLMNEPLSLSFAYSKSASKSESFK